MSRYKTNSWSLSQQNIRIYFKHFFSFFFFLKTIVNDYVLKWEWHVKINKYEVGLSRGVAIRAVNIILTNFSLGKKQMWQCWRRVNRDSPADSLPPRPAGLSVSSERKEEVEASQWDVSLLLLLLQRRSQRGSLWLPRNHARYTEEIRTVFIQFFTMNGRNK